MAEGIVIGNLTIPVIKGDKGDKGDTGEIISISLVLLSPSSTAYAVNNGSTTQAQIELGIPKGLSVSTTNINASGELVFTFNDNSTVNVGKVVGKGISEIAITEEYDFVVTYTDGTSATVGNLETEIIEAINTILEDYYTKTEIDEMGFITKEVNNLTNYYKKDETYTKQEVDNKVASVYKYKGTVATYADLPSSDLTIGDVYNVESDGSNYAWTGTDWDKLGGNIDLSGYQEKIDNSHKLSADLVDDTNHTNKFVTASEKEQITTNATDISNIKDGTSIDSFGDVETALSGKEDSSNKVTSIDENSTNTQYPSAKLVYDELVEKDEEINQLWNDYPDILDNNALPSGTDLTLNGTGDLKMKVDVGGNSTQGSLPNEYQQVEYIESSGTQYIDTGFIPDYTNGYQIEVDFAPNKLGYRYSILSGYDAQNALCLEITNSNQGRIYCYNGAVGVYIGTVTTQKNTFGVKFKNSIFTYSVNGSSDSISYSSAATVNESLYMFMDRQLRYSIFSQPLKIYTCKLYNNDVLVRNFIPCYRKSDNVIGLYDVANNAFYTNQGTGTFTKGNDTPNPTYKQDINNVEGNVVVISKNSDNTKSNSVTFPLSQGQKLMLGDTLEDDGIHHKRRQVVIDGTENWRMNYNTSICILDLEPQYYGSYTGDTIISPIKSNCYISQRYTDMYFSNVDYGISLGGSNPDIIGIRDKNLSSLTEYKTYFAEQYANETPVIVEYELATETIEPYTSAQQTAYNKLKEMQSYYDLTYVVGSSNNAQPILTVQAKKSLKVMNNEINNLISRVTLLED